MEMATPDREALQSKTNKGTIREASFFVVAQFHWKVPWMSATKFSTGCPWGRTMYKIGIFVAVQSNYEAEVAQSVQRLTTDWMTAGRSPTEAEDFSCGPWVQTGSEAHPVSYPMGTGGSFPGGKARPGCDADHLPPSSAEVKYE
jgi:hypothetical protein